MNKELPIKKTKHVSDLAGLVGVKAARKLKAKRGGSEDVWFGLGMMGLIGWSVVVPTLLGAAIGLWLDKNHPGEHAWTLALLMLGLTIGCANAWHWVVKEDREMHENRIGKLENDDD